jgi:hypothetical protein
MELVLYLKDRYDAEVIVSRGDYGVYQYTSITDADLVIEHEESVRILSFSERKSRIVDILEQRDNVNDILVVPHLEHSYHNLDRDFTFDFKLKKTPMLPYSPRTNYEYYYVLRKMNRLTGVETIKDKMFFLFGTPRADGPILRERGIISESPGNLNINEYLKMSVEYNIGLAIAGSAEVCHRDFEYLATGLPLLRLKYMRDTDPPLIANYHYIAVERKDFPESSDYDREYGDREPYVKAYTERFMEVKDDQDFLDFIAANGRQYYLDNCTYPNRIINLVKKLELDWSPLSESN